MNIRGLSYGIITSLALTVTAVSCSGPSCDDIASRVSEGKELDSDDYDAMIQYLYKATESQIPQLREARTMDDITRIDKQTERDFPYSDMFITALLHDYDRLSKQQTERIAELRDMAREAYPNK